MGKWKPTTPEQAENKRATSKAHYERNKEKISARRKERYAANREFILAQTKAYQKANRDKLELARKANYEEKKLLRLAYGKKYRADNKEKRRAWDRNNAVIRKKLIGGQAIAKSYRKETRDVYLNCPEGHHVDHIVPLKGKIVCGLHVPWNLQYLPALDNIKKGNKHEDS